MSDVVIFQVDCSHPTGWMNEAIIRCDLLMLSEDHSVSPISTELNPCAVPHTVLQWPTRMKQIILTSCFILQEYERESIHLPLIPDPSDFWLGNDDHAPTELHLDYSAAVQLSEQVYLIKLLEQPPVHVEDYFQKEEENLVVTQGNLDDMTTKEQPGHAFETTPSHLAPLNASTTSSKCHGNPHDWIHNPPQSQTLTPLELFLQQEEIKTNRLIGFVMILSLALVGIFGFIGLRLFPVRRRSKAEEAKRNWWARQALRMKNRPIHGEKKRFLRPIPTPPRRKDSPPKPVCVSPPRPLSPPPQAKKLSAAMGSFANELKAKADGTNGQESRTAPKTWEEVCAE